MNPLNTEVVLERFRKTWGDRFDYSQVAWRGPYKSVSVRCQAHNHSFSINPGRHWRGSVGCRYCQHDSFKLTQNEVLQRFNNTWGNRYDYSQFVYYNQLTKSTIICIEHGPFDQEPVNHWTGHGCPRCALKLKHGLGSYNQNNTNIVDVQGVVYVLEIQTETEHFFKVGISKHGGKKRIADSGRKLSGKAKVIFESQFIPLTVAYTVEQQVLNTNTKYIPSFKYNGWKESIHDNPVEQVKELLGE